MTNCQGADKQCIKSVHRNLSCDIQKYVNLSSEIKRANSDDKINKLFFMYADICLKFMLHSFCVQEGDKFTDLSHSFV